MGAYAKAQICFGTPIYIDEDEYDFDLPWLEYGDDIDYWWQEVKGFKPSLNIYTKEYDYIPGLTEDMKETYYRERDVWWEANTLPISLETHGHYEQQQYILAVPGTLTYVEWGDTIQVRTLLHQTVNPREVFELEKFAKLYLPEFKLSKPTWIMSCEYS